MRPLRAVSGVSMTRTHSTRRSRPPLPAISSASRKPPCLIASLTVGAGISRSAVSGAVVVIFWLAFRPKNEVTFFVGGRLAQCAPST